MEAVPTPPLNCPRPMTAPVPAPTLPRPTSCPSWSGGGVRGGRVAHVRVRPGREVPAAAQVEDGGGRRQSGTTPPVTAKPLPFSSHQRWAPWAAARPKALPPVRTTASTAGHQGGGIERVGLMRAGAAAADVHRAHGLRRGQDHRHPAQPALAGLCRLPHTDSRHVRNGSSWHHSAPRRREQTPAPRSQTTLCEYCNQQ